MANAKDTAPRIRTYAEIMAEVNAQIAKDAQRNLFGETNDGASLSCNEVKLPLWPEAVRGVPNVVLRSALFGISIKRKFHKTRTLIASVDGYEIRFKGEVFNQTDLDVWEMLLHLARLQPLETEVKFTAHSLLRELGRGIGKSQHEQLKEELLRLISGGVEITWKDEKKSFAGALVSSYFRDDDTGHYVVKFNQDMLTLYEAGHTLIDWSQRMALGKNNLAKWLHDQYATHAKPHPYKVETIRDLSGSDTAELWKFRQTLRKALDALKAVGAIMGWSIDEDDLVHVVRPPSGSQCKHLALKKATPRRKN
jgi:hypothetical protein